MTAPTLEADPVTGPASSGTRALDALELAAPDRGSARRLRAERRPFAEIRRETWDGLAARNPWATPFSAWSFHRAWWDGYGESAHEQTLVVVDPDRPADAEPVAIVPLMHRHVVEASDAATHTMIRHGARPDLTPVEPTAKAIYFGASYHADYATVLADPADLPVVADAVAESLGAEARVDPDHPAAWDVVDLRRLRRGDHAGEALAAAFGSREMAEDWTLNLEREEVCPVTTLPAIGDIDAFLATLGKKERHEIRRKVRRAETHGGLRFVESRDALGPAMLDDGPAPDARGRTDLEIFIDLHQARWGADGLFPETPGGAQSRVFVRRLFEEFGRTTGAVADCPIRLNFLWIRDLRVAASIHFETADSILYYNAGIDPDWRGLSPGVLLVWSLVQRALATGRTRLDFLRGDEPYKYEWGARDEPIQRLLVRRNVSSGSA